MTNNAVSTRRRRGVVAIPRSARLLFALLARLRRGRLEVIGPSGQSFSFPGSLPGPDALIRVADWEVCHQVLDSGDVGFAEAYLQGRWDTPDLAAVLTLAAMNHPALQEAWRGRWWAKLSSRLRCVLHASTGAAGRRNVHSHYDLGSGFYRRWLDPTMTYSSALFEGDPARSLEQAQVAKFERILNLLAPRPGQRILEIGCGWGGFAEHAARTRGCSVHAVTVSWAQLEFARERIRAAGLDTLVDLQFRDYRDVEGSFDFVVSIEMYEVVGSRFWPSYFRTVRDRLKPGGRALLQAIVVAEALFARYQRGTDFIRQYIHPGAMLASQSEFGRQAQSSGLKVASIYAFGQDYAETLVRWARRFNSAWPDLPAGFDGRFRRLWNFYLAYCEAGFRAGNTDVMQVELCRA